MDEVITEISWSTWTEPTEAFEFFRPTLTIRGVTALGFDGIMSRNHAVLDVPAPRQN